MTIQSVPTQQTDTSEDALNRIDEAIATLELAWRVDHSNEQDFGMLQRVCHMTMRLLEGARETLHRTETKA